MSRILLLCFTSIMALVCSPATLRADQIGFATLSNEVGSPVIANQVRLTVEFGSSVSGPPVATVFDVVVGPTDVGRTFSLSSGPEFEAAARFLTDGVNGGIGFFSSFVTGGGGGGSRSEAFRFFGDASGSGRVDFAGFEITSLDFRLDELILDSPGTNPSGNGIWTDLSVRSVLTVNGRPAVATPVPEPATLCLMGLGLVGFYVGGRTRARRRAPPVLGK